MANNEMEVEFEKYDEDPNEIGYTIFNGNVIYNPRNAVRVFVRGEAEEYLRLKYGAGVYKGKEKCNAILRYLFTFYQSKIDSLVPLIANKNWLAFILFQYEQSSKIDRSYKNNTLSDSESEYWKMEGPPYRQTIDFLCEKFVQYCDEEAGKELSSLDQALIFDLVWISTKLAVGFANVSNLTHMVIPNDTVIEIFPAGNDIFIDHNVLKSSGFDKCFEKYSNRAKKDIELRNRFIEGEPFESDIRRHISFLDTPLKDKLGVTFTQLLDILYSIANGVKPISSPGKIPMISKSEYFKKIAEIWKITIENVEQIFEGIVLNKKMMVTTEREIWNYKQPNRMSKRPFLEIQYLGEKHLMWSNSKLKDFFTLLESDLPFGLFPNEWNNKDVTKGIGKLSNEAGKWFERQLKINLLKLGIIGDNYEKVIKSSKERLVIDKIVGGLDYFGYSESDNLLILVECKMLNSGFESKGFRQEKDKFLNPKKGFVKKMKLKTKWVIENYEKLYRILADTPKFENLKENPPKGLACLFVTYYATMASCYVEEIPCVTLPELMEKYEAENKWPFQIGIVDL